MPKLTTSLHDTNDPFSLRKFEHDLESIYQNNTLHVGLPKNFKGIFSALSRPNTIAIVGVALGDEGKGRIVDNKIEELLKKKSITRVSVIRFQGGNNAGHTVEKEGTKLALHLIPSFVFHEKAEGIMDRGMVVHVEDLLTEMRYVEDVVGTLTNRLHLSDDAILCTDLERAEEFLNGYLQEGSKGGTGRGIGPSYAHHYDKTGLRIADLLRDDWSEHFTKRFIQYEKIFSAFGLALSDTDVPDFSTTVREKKASRRKLGTKKEFLQRLRDSREQLLRRNLVTNTFPLHITLAKDSASAIVFEGAQAAGLDSWTGTRPDVTSSNTTAYGVREGTGYWRLQDIEERIGIIKLPYTSSVGARRMPTHIDLQKDTQPTTNDQHWGQWVRDTAFEYGTTTGRPRDINFLDLPFIAYNIRMSGIETLMSTHLDICKEEDSIKICTHYTDTKGNTVPYQPGLRYLAHLTPNYTQVPGWEGKSCQNAKKAEDLPVHALKFLSLIQSALHTPLVATTTGPSRKHFLTF